MPRFFTAWIGGKIFELRFLMQHSTRPPNLQTASLFSNCNEGWFGLAAKMNSAIENVFFFSCRYSTRTKYMKESETDEILFSNISYLKQFRLNKMGAEVVISDRFLISKFLKGLTHCAVVKLHKMKSKNFHFGTP